MMTTNFGGVAFDGRELVLGTTANLKNYCDVAYLRLLLLMGQICRCLMMIHVS